MCKECLWLVVVVASAPLLEITSFAQGRWLLVSRCQHFAEKEKRRRDLLCVCVRKFRLANWSSPPPLIVAPFKSAVLLCVCVCVCGTISPWSRAPWPSPLFFFSFTLLVSSRRRRAFLAAETPRVHASSRVHPLSLLDTVKNTHVCCCSSSMITHPTLFFFSHISQTERWANHCQRENCSHPLSQSSS